MLTLVIGGSASGKSEFAEQLAMDCQEMPKLYVATMYPYDEECRKRIRRHQIMREGKGFITLEQPLNLCDLNIPTGGTVLVECLSNLVANELYPPGQETGRTLEKDNIIQSVLYGISKMHKNAGSVIVVSNDVFAIEGQSIPSIEKVHSVHKKQSVTQEQAECVYNGQSSLCYLSCLAEINRSIAKQADQVVEVVAGIPIYHKTTDNIKRIC